MFFSKNESGLLLTEDLKQIIELAVQHEGKASIVARKSGISAQNIATWRGNVAATQTLTISWAQWEKFREYLVKEELIKLEDPRWMLPSEMRQRLLDLNVDAEVSQLLAYFSQLSPTGKNTALNVIRSLIPTLNQEASTSGMSVSKQA